MSDSQRVSGLNSLKGLKWGIIEGSILGVIKGDARSLDYTLLIWFMGFLEYLLHNSMSMGSLLGLYQGLH